VRTLERERKLAGRAEVLDALEGDEIEPRTFTSTYHDTADRQLARHGITLRRRVENGVSRWQLKLPREAGRLELEKRGGPARVPAELADLLAGVLHSAELEPVVVLRTRRTGKRASLAAGTVEAVVDEVARMEGRRAADEFTELELELVEGEPPALKEAEKVLVKAGAKAGKQRAKALRYLGVEPKPPLADGAAAIDRVRARIEDQYGEIVRHDPAVRVGDDAEDLHDLRVAVRRLRALLRAADALLVPEWSATLRDELEWLGDELARARDLDVLLEHLRAEAATLDGDQVAFADVLVRLEADRTDAREQVLTALRSERYARLLDALASAAKAPHARALDVPLGEVASGEFRRLAKAVGKLGDEPTDDELHRVRIKAKRARYAAELAEPVSGKAAARFVKSAKRFQDVVGEHQDAVVAEERLRELAHELESGDAVLAAGRIVERQHERRRAAREALPKVWAKLERSGRRAWA
jgi:CHAD domain-containing protein